MTDKLERAFPAAASPGAITSLGASGSPAFQPGLLKRFNPYDFDDAQVRGQATGRTPLVRHILEVTRDNAGRREPPNQHLLVLGPRGMGKSFLVRWVQVEIEALARAPADVPVAGGPAPIRFVRLSEEQLNVSAPELLLDEIRRVLEGRPADAVRVRWRAGGEAEWRTALEALGATISALPGFADDRGLVVVSIENFDLLLEEVFADPAAQSRLRALLAAEPRLMLLATATRPPDQDAGKRLFQAFERIPLAPWRPHDFVAFYQRAFRGGLTITPEVEAKILALAHFLGGSPRLAVLMGDILSTNDALSAVQTLDQLIDELTPYYQDRILNRLKSKPRWLLDEMLRGGEPCSQTELAKRVGANSQSDIARDFEALQRDQIVTGHRETGGRKGLYRVADRVFAHFFRKRYLASDSHSPLAAMVDFLESFYTQQELIEQVERLTAQGELEKAGILTRALWLGADWHGTKQSVRRRVCRRLIEEATEILGEAIEAPLAELLSRLDALIRAREIPHALDRTDRALGLARTPAEQLVVRLARGMLYTTLPADDKAVELLRVLVADAGQLGNRPLFALALEACADSEAYLGDQAAADRRYQQAAGEAQAIGDQRRHAWVLNGQLWYFSLTERWDAFDAAFGPAMEAVPAAGYDDVLARLHSNLCYREYRKGDLDAALAASEEAVRLSRQCGDDATLALAAGNYSASLNRLKRHEEALTAAQMQQDAAERAGEDDLLLEGAKRELFALTGLERLQEVIDRAPRVLELAQQLGEPDEQIRVHWLVSNAYQALQQREVSLDPLWQAADLCARTKDDALFSNVRGALIARLAEDRRQNAGEIVDVYLGWIDRVPPEDGREGESPTFSGYQPGWRFDAFAGAATLAGRWPEVIESLDDWEREHPAALKALPAASFGAGDVAVELSESDGPGPAFSAAAGLLRAVGAALGTPEPLPALADFLRTLAHASCTRFIARLSDPGLLRDLAEEVRGQLGDADIAGGLEAAALYREQGGDPRALEKVDPDIREAVSTLLGIREEDSGPKSDRKPVPGVGTPRADDAVTAEERAAITAALRQPPISWPTAPLYAADWTELSPEDALQPVVAMLGAARTAKNQRTLRAGVLFLDLMCDEQGFGQVAARALASTRAVRRAHPSFYPKWTLYECLVPRPADQTGDGDWAVIDCLVGEDAVIPMLGISAPIHALNAKIGFPLAEADQAAAYLRFFCNAVRNELGPFRLIESLDQLPLTSALEPDQLAKIQDHLRPLRLEQQGGDGWTCSALVQYGYALFFADFLAKPSGAIEMLNDEPLLVLETIRRDRLVSGLRWHDGVFPSDDDDDEADNE